MTEPDPASLEGAPGERAAVGVDEWVARSGERQEALPGPLGAAQRALGRVGWWPRLAVAVVLGAIIPQLGLNDFQFQIGINMLLLALLAVGLNISVGWAGLLDLGYIAFYGFGAYGFALLSSSQIGGGIHWPAYASVPVVMIAAGVLGLLVGLPSRRLIGDYLAIVTLFFGEAFVEFTNNVASGTLGGPNGITSIDPYKGFGAPDHDQRGLLLPAARAARGRLRGGAHARSLAPGPGLARGARGPARRRADDDPGQPGQADGVQLRCRHRRAGRHRVRSSADQRVSDRLRHAVSHPHLRRAHPRRSSGRSAER